MFISYSSTDASTAFSAHVSWRGPTVCVTLFPQKAAFERTAKTAADDQQPLLWSSNLFFFSSLSSNREYVG